MINRGKLRQVGNVLRQVGRDFVRMQPAPADERKLQDRIQTIPQSKITQAQKRGDLAEFRRLTQQKTRLQTQLRSKVSARNKPIAKEAAINMVPLAWTRHWNSMTPSERAANLMIDIVTVGIPLARPAAGSARTIAGVTKNTVVGSSKVLNSGLKNVNAKMTRGKTTDIRKAGELLEMLSKQVDPSAKRAFEKRGQFLKDNANDVSIIVRNSQGKKPVFEIPKNISKPKPQTELKTTRKTRTAVAEVDPVQVKKLQDAFKVLNRDAFDALSKSKPKAKPPAVRAKAKPPAVRAKAKSPGSAKLKRTTTAKIMRKVGPAIGTAAKTAIVSKAKSKPEKDPTGTIEKDPTGKTDKDPTGKTDKDPTGKTKKKPPPAPTKKDPPPATKKELPPAPARTTPQRPDPARPPLGRTAPQRPDPARPAPPRGKKEQDPAPVRKDAPQRKPDTVTRPDSKPRTRVTPKTRTSVSAPPKRTARFDLPSGAKKTLAPGTYPDRVTFVDGITRWFVDLSDGSSRAMRARKVGKPRETFRVLSTAKTKPKDRRIPLGMVSMQVDQKSVSFSRRKPLRSRSFRSRK